MNKTSISVYSGELTTVNTMEQVKRLRGAFPNIQKEFYDLLIERAKEKGFSDDRLTDAVNNLIDTFKYPQPRVADIISWDKRVELMSYNEMMDLYWASGGNWKGYVKQIINKRVYYVSKIELNKLGLDATDETIFKA